MEAIDQSKDPFLDNIIFPYDSEPELRRISQGFDPLTGERLRGTVGAGDGIVFRMKKPPADQVDGNVSTYFNRKGFWGYSLQAFCDSSCKFTSISMRLYSSAYDGTAYRVSSMATKIREGKLPAWAHIVLDEAYICTNQELTPFKGRGLSDAQDSFNYHLSLQRQVIERAFGLLVGRWGVFWRPLRVEFSKISLVIGVACKLHNICVSRFGPRVSEISNADVQQGDEARVIYTDDIPVHRGHRSDQDETSKRYWITAMHERNKWCRPDKRMAFSRVARCKDLPN